MYTDFPCLPAWKVWLSAQFMGRIEGSQTCVTQLLAKLQTLGPRDALWYQPFKEKPLRPKVSIPLCFRVTGRKENTCTQTDQSVASWLELNLPQLDWLSSARRQSQNPSLAWLGLKQVLNFQAQLGLGSDKILNYELSQAPTRGKWIFWAWPNKTNMD